MVLLQQMKPVSLEGMAAAGLMSRVEQKYVLPVGQLAQLLVAMQASYAALEMDGVREFGYTTHYFDSEDFRLYHDHHNGYVNRIKVRQRQYDHTGEFFFEIKRRVGELRSEKRREPIAALSDVLPMEQATMIRYRHMEGRAPELKLCNRFRRMTYCNEDRNERVTIDREISMEHAGVLVTLPGIALVEVKQLRLNRNGTACRWLREQRVQSGPFSKYALGAALLYDKLKQNNFKATMNNIRQYGAQ